MEYGKKIKILSAVIALLAVTYIMGIVFSSANINRRKSEEKVISKNAIEQISSITVDLEEDGSSLQIQKNSDGKWSYTENGKEYPASDSKILNFIDSVGNLTKYQLVGSDKKLWEKFELDGSTGKKALFSDSTGKELFTLYVGKNSTVESSGEYFATSFSDNVYLSGAPVKRYFLRDKEYWSDLKIFPEGIETPNIVSVKITANIPEANEREALEIDFNIKKETSDIEDEWLNLLPSPQLDEIDINSVNNLIGNILSLNGDSFFDSEMPEEIAQIEIETENAGVFYLDIALFDENNIVVTVEGSDYKYLLGYYKVQRILDGLETVFSTTE